jgi:hypothetical protein
MSAPGLRQGEPATSRSASSRLARKPLVASQAARRSLRSVHSPFLHTGQAPSCPWLQIWQTASCSGESAVVNVTSVESASRQHPFYTLSRASARRLAGGCSCSLQTWCAGRAAREPLAQFVDDPAELAGHAIPDEPDQRARGPR